MAKLTAIAVENIRPGAARREVPDSLSGVRLVVQPSGAKSWAVRFKIAGRSRKLTLGGYPPISLQSARELAREALLKVARGIDPATERAAARADTFEAVVELFLDRYVRQHCRPRTASEYQRILARTAKAWRGRPIALITRRELIAHLDEIADRSGPIASNRTRATISSLFAWAVKRDIINASPAVGLPAPLPETPRKRVLTDGELAAIWRAAELLGYPGGPFVQMLVLTGARRSEIAALTWQEIDLEARRWVLPAARAKNGLEHEVPLSGPALAILAGLPRIGSTGFVFTVGGSSPIAGFSQIKTAFDALAPIEAWTFHDLRRTAATVMADRLSIAPHVVEAVLGHLHGARIARIYNRAQYLDEKRAALQRWAEHVTGETSRVVVLHPAR